MTSFLPSLDRSLSEASGHTLLRSCSRVSESIAGIRCAPRKQNRKQYVIKAEALAPSYSHSRIYVELLQEPI